MENPLIQAVLDENVAQVAALLEQGADPNVFEDADKIRPLHFVAQKDSQAALKIAELLIQVGANPLARTEPDGQTSIEIAELMSNPEMVSVLLGSTIEVH